MSAGLRQLRTPSCAGRMTDQESNLQPPLLGAKISLPPPASSLLSRLLNIFAIPSAVFEEMSKSRHSTGNWLLPTALCCVVMVMWSFAVLAMPAMQKNLAEVHEKQIQTIETAVAEGKQTRSQGDDLIKTINTIMQPTVMRVLAVGGGLAGVILRVFGWAFVLWLIARRFLQFPLPYSKALEVVGLSGMVALLDTVVRLALVVELHPPGAGIAVSDLGLSGSFNLTHLLMNLLRFWLLALMATGLARMTSVVWFRAALPVFVCGMVVDLLAALFGFGLLRAG